jgi:UDP-N-acetylglucosamine 2-epimerase (non-hydrolysing)
MLRRPRVYRSLRPRDVLNRCARYQVRADHFHQRIRRPSRFRRSRPQHWKLQHFGADRRQRKVNVPLIDIIAGVRPNFMKIAPIIRALEARQAAGSELRFRLVHTGQHYDARMSGDFFTQLGIPEPDVNLEVGSGTQAEQTAAIMMRYEALLLEVPPGVCLVVGDVTSTMACALAAQKLRVPVAHVEAGIRSGDWTMPEEINRMVTDAITNWFFTTSDVANANLRRSGVSDERIFFVGNTMIDTLLYNLPRLQPPAFWDSLKLQTGAYFVLTLHRPGNVDEEEGLATLLAAIAMAARALPIVFPVHPRTAVTLAQIADLPANVHFVGPQPYLEFNFLVRGAKAVITDSGGITEEATVLGVPCMTLRANTERPETVTVGTNELLGTDPAAIAPALDRLFAGDWKKGSIPEKWDGHTGERIVSVLETLLSGNG